VIWTHNWSLVGKQDISRPVSLLVVLVTGLFSHLSLHCDLVTGHPMSGHFFIFLFWRVLFFRKKNQSTKKRCCVQVRGGHTSLDSEQVKSVWVTTEQSTLNLRVPLRVHQRDHRWQDLCPTVRWRSVSSKLSLNTTFVCDWTSFSTNWVFQLTSDRT
jgi:hypothetical protein